MESSLSERLLLIPKNCLIIELVQAVYLHIPILLCQEQCLEFYFIFNSGLPINQVQYIDVLYKVCVFILVLFCMVFEIVSKQWPWLEEHVY